MTNTTNVLPSMRVDGQIALVTGAGREYRGGLCTRAR